MNLLSPDNLACIQGTEELGAVGTDLGGRGWGLWKESEIGWSALRKTGEKKKKGRKAPCHCRIHPLVSKRLKDPDRDLQPALLGWSRKHSNAQRQLLRSQSSSFQIVRLWSEPFSFNKFPAAESVLSLSYSPSEDTCIAVILSCWQPTKTFSIFKQSYTTCWWNKFQKQTSKILWLRSQDSID